MLRQFVLPVVLILAFILATQVIQNGRLIGIYTAIVDITSSKEPIKKNRFDPFVNRWQMKFHTENRRDGYLFFKHIRKAGGTTMRNYLAKVLEHHNNPRTVAEFIRNVKSEYISDQLLDELRRVGNLGENELDLMNVTIHTMNSMAAAKKRYQIHYAEQEFSAMDWECSRVDPRWKNTLSVIMLRHPIERHLSEFFYSGPGSSLGLDAAKLFGDENNQYKKRVRKKLLDELPGWLDDTYAESRSVNFYFGRHYTDNFQLRALAGCAQGSCLQSKNLTAGENSTLERNVNTHLSSANNTNGACTMYFSEKVRIIEPCRSYGRSSKSKFERLCPYGCDTPCRYPVSAWGTVGHEDLSRAITALNSYDAVFLTETLDNDDQSAFLADVMGVPINATFALRSKNTKTKKTSDREKTHFYRDLLLNLTLDGLYDRIHEENALEIELFNYAVDLNMQMVEQWRHEKGLLE